MRLGWLVSILAHIAFVCAGLLVWPTNVKPFNDNGAIIPVEVVTDPHIPRQNWDHAPVVLERARRRDHKTVRKLRFRQRAMYAESA